MFARMPRLCSARARSSRLWPPRSSAWRQFLRASSIASGIQAARSRAGASCNRSAAGRTGGRGAACPGAGTETAVTTVSPRDHVIREVVDLPRDVLAEQIVEGQKVVEDLQVVRRVRDPLGEQLA